MFFWEDVGFVSLWWVLKMRVVIWLSQGISILLGVVEKIAQQWVIVAEQSLSLSSENLQSNLMSQFSPAWLSLLWE